MSTQRVERTVWKNRGGIGKVYVRGGFLWTSIGNVRESTGVRYPESGSDEQGKALKRAKAICQERALQHSHPELIIVDDEVQTVKTLYAAIADFTESKLTPSMPRSIRSRYKCAISHFLLSPRHGDMPMQFNAIRKRIEQRLRAYKGADSVREKLLYKLSKIMQYFVSCGYLNRNPMEVIDIDPAEREDENEDIDRDVAVYSLKEVEQMITWLRDHDYPRHADAVELMFLLGLRPVEPLRARAEHWDGQCLTVYGKKVKGNKSGKRILPILDSRGQEIRPGVMPLLTRLLDNAHLYGGYLFPWRSTSSIQPLHKTCREDLGIVDGRTLKTLRSTANWYFREHLRWTKSFRCEFLGHSERVNRKHYDRRRTPAEMVTFAEERMRPHSGTTEPTVQKTVQDESIDHIPAIPSKLRLYIR